MALDKTDFTPETTPVSIPGLTYEPGLWASYRIARRNVLELIPERAYHEPVLTGGKGAGWIMITDPAAMERVLKDRVDAYPKNEILKRLMRPRRGTNLIVSEGESARRQRRVFAPVFAARAMENAAQIMTDAARDMVHRIELARVDNQPMDVFPQMQAATCDIICDLVLSGREAVDRDALRQAVDAFIATQGRISIFDLLGVPNVVPRPFELTDNSRLKMDRMADKVVAARLARGPSDPPDLLDLMLQGDPGSGDGLDRLMVRNNLLGFLFAGHETTALTLTWALYLLAFDRDVQSRLREEIQSALGARETAAHVDLAHLPLTERVIKEALRLYAPAGFLTRKALEADELAGTPVKAGATVILPIHAMHRHHQLWEQPDAFDPDRFLPERSEGRHRYAYMPFGGGSRVCIGAALALQEAKILLASLIACYDFALPPGYQPKPQMWFTLRPANGMQLSVTRVCRDDS
ncbi:MAG: cytochrome P450 [Pseudomonadota bacterium]